MLWLGPEGHSAFGFLSLSVTFYVIGLMLFIFLNLVCWIVVSYLTWLLHTILTRHPDTPTLCVEQPSACDLSK
jgi:hypothetical protein